MDPGRILNGKQTEYRKHIDRSTGWLSSKSNKDMIRGVCINWKRDLTDTVG